MTRALGRADSARERVIRRESAAATEKRNIGPFLSESIYLTDTVAPLLDRYSAAGHTVCG
jgi:hypothetical protein